LLVLCRDPSDGQDPLSAVDLWAVLRMQTLPQPASIVHGNGESFSRVLPILGFLRWYRCSTSFGRQQGHFVFRGALSVRCIELVQRFVDIIRRRLFLSHCFPSIISDQSSHPSVEDLGLGTFALVSFVSAPLNTPNANCMQSGLESARPLLLPISYPFEFFCWSCVFLLPFFCFSHYPFGTLRTRRCILRHNSYSVQIGD
jgi:hypothetical protein